MPQKIMIVEDEVVVSTDIRAKLKLLGYEPASPIVRYGEKVLDAAVELRPDLILMDIRLKGEMDGIEAAQQIRALNIPVVFLTAYSDDDTLNRAKMTGPYAYLKKPVRLEDLRISIDIGLYKAGMDKKSRESELRFRTVADFTYDWETWVGPDGKYVYMSPSCERISGYPREKFYSRPLLMTDIVFPPDKAAVTSHLEQCHQPDSDIIHIEFRILRPDDEERWIEHICQPVYSPEGVYIGRRASNRDITYRKKADIEREKLIAELQEALKNIRTLSGLLPICSQCKKIRDDQGYWKQLERFISDHSDARFSHGICPDCMKKLYPEFADAVIEREDDSEK